MHSPGIPAQMSARAMQARARFPTLPGTQHMSDAQHIERRLIELNVEHRDLDAVIELLILDGHHDELQLRRLKKRKLQLKDHITLLKMQLVPDVPA